MKRDHSTIKQRIDDLGIKKTHVEKQCGLPTSVLTKIIRGEKYRLKKETIDTIHNYLDLCKTIFKKGKDFK